MADPAKIQHAAQRIATLSRSHPLIVVVSAMGNTTNSLIDLAHQVSSRPHRRELDMLLSVGERMSMSLLSMALNDLGRSAISFTGSQAGILTDDSHVNAFIQDVKPLRVIEALQKNQIVILAGFQGVSPVTKEITTLGRGGSDTTAMAMAAFFKAQRCDILKEVRSVFSADPRKVSEARPLHKLSYQNLADMTFWGAKVLHYRSAELALHHQVPVYIGPAADDRIDLKEGTLISEEESMFFEGTHFLALNSHEHVCVVEVKSADCHGAIYQLKKFLESRQIPWPLLLQSQDKGTHWEIWLAGPEELIHATEKELSGSSFRTDSQNFSTNCSTVTMTCTGAASGEASEKVAGTLKEAKIPMRSLLCQSNNITTLLPRAHQGEALKVLHRLIEGSGKVTA